MDEIYINVGVAENDDQGNKSDYASMFTFGDLLTLESVHMGKERFTHTAFKKSKKPCFRIHRKLFLYFEEYHWTGNMIWNSYKMHWHTVCELINHLYHSGKWSILSGDSLIVDHLEEHNLLMQGDFLDVCKQYYQTETSVS